MFTQADANSELWRATRTRNAESVSSLLIKIKFEKDNKYTILIKAKKCMCKLTKVQILHYDTFGSANVSRLKELRIEKKS